VEQRQRLRRQGQGTAPRAGENPRAPVPEVAPLQAAIPLAREVVAKGHAGKSSLVLDFRNRCPDELLPWIDASVVLAGENTLFPPLLGTGGNDGRLDFSTNFHQRLLEVIGPPRSLARARDLLAAPRPSSSPVPRSGSSTRPVRAGPARRGSARRTRLVNPWGYVLFVEARCSSRPAPRAVNQFAAGRAAMPFTVAASPDGTGSGAAHEETRGEVWAPLWSRDLTLPEIRQLFAEARASWRGRPARRAADFYAATRTLGVARGIDQFTRYGLQRRNGLAFAAVRSPASTSARTRGGAGPPTWRTGRARVQRKRHHRSRRRGGAPLPARAPGVRPGRQPEQAGAHAGRAHLAGTGC